MTGTEIVHDKANMKLSDIKTRVIRMGRSGGYFLTNVAMSVMKHDEAVRNSQVKRGEWKRSNHTDIAKCGCGDVTCHFECDLTKYYDHK